MAAWTCLSEPTLLFNQHVSGRSVREYLRNIFFNVGPVLFKVVLDLLNDTRLEVRVTSFSEPLYPLFLTLSSNHLAGPPYNASS
jgi:hypothetical protein